MNPFCSSYKTKLFLHSQIFNTRPPKNRPTNEKSQTCVDKFKLLNVNPTTQPDITANTDKVSRPFLLQYSFTHSRNFGDMEFLIRFLKYSTIFLHGLAGGEWHWEDAGLEVL